MFPHLFSIGEFHIRAWGLMVALGILVATLVSKKLAEKEGLDGEIILDYVLYAVVAGILGARVWEIIFSWSNFENNPLSALEFWNGGLSIQGGVAAGLIVTLWFVRRHKLNFWQFADVLAPGLILGQAIGRIGCFLNGDAYGIPANSWFGVVYKPGTPAFNAFGAVPLIPAELMEAAGDLLIFGLLIFLLKHRPFRGFVALMYFALYSLLRFTLEFWRADSLLIAPGLKAAQISSLLILAGACILIVYKYMLKSKSLRQK